MASKGNGPKNQPVVYEPGHDLRLDFIFEFITRSFKIKIDKWLRFLTTDEFKRTLYAFLDDPEIPHICFTVTSSGVLKATDVYETALKTKSCFFIKKHPIPMLKSEPDFKENLIFGELAGHLLKHLVLTTDEVISPAIRAETSNEKWPEDVVADARDRAEEIKNALVCLKGLLCDKTWLPWPDHLQDIIQQADAGSVDIKSKREVENLVMKWSYQIGEVLKRDSGELFQEGRNPTPLDEIKFWEARLEDLKSLHEQLTGPGALSINAILEITKSKYWPYLKSLLFNVQCALEECRSIVRHFQPLRRHLDLITTATFDCELRNFLRPLMHSVCLLWAYSNHYRQSVRIIMLLRQICNLLIDLARNFLNGSLIFQLEPEEAYLKLKCVGDLLDSFKELYHAHRDSIWAYFEPGQPVHKWDFYPHSVFTRFDSFQKRVEKLKLLFQTAVEFSKLEATEIGGSQGKKLSAGISGVHEDFAEQFQKFSSISYDCCDPESADFDTDCDLFLKISKTLDYRISCILAHAMKDCHTPESAFKLIITLTPLLGRPLIRETVREELSFYVQLIHNQITQVETLFEEQVLHNPDSAAFCTVYRHLPPFSSLIHTVKYFKDQMETSFLQFQSLELSDGDLSPALRDSLHQHYYRAREHMSEFQNQVFQRWCESITSDGTKHLHQTIFVQDLSFTDKITVNFHNSLSAALKEVKYLRIAGYTETIPPVANELFERREQIRRDHLHLCKIASVYNHLNDKIHGLQSTERELLLQYVESYENTVHQGLTTIRWDTEDLWGFIQALQEPIQQCEQRLNRSRENWVKVNKLVASCNHGPLFARVSNSRYRLLDLGKESQVRLEKAYSYTNTISGEITSLCANSRSLLVSDKKADAATVASKWYKYLSQIDRDIIFGLSKVVSSSLGYLLDHTDENLTTSSLLQATLLLNKGIAFQPRLQGRSESEFCKRIESMIDAIFHQASLLERVDTSTGGNYEKAVRENPTIVDMVSEIRDRILQTAQEAEEFTEDLQRYSNIWTLDRQKYLHQFLQHGKALPPEEENTNDTLEALQGTPPSIEDFREEMDKYYNLTVEIGKLPRQKTFRRWFTIDLSPFLQSLLQLTQDWGQMFKQHLIDSVTGSLNDLEKFIQDTHAKLAPIPLEGDLEALIQVMGLLHRIKSRSPMVSGMFEPLKETIELLRSYDYEPPETVFVQLDELPVRWQGLLKTAATVKASVAPLQQNEVVCIKRKIAAFETVQASLRDAFQQMEFLDVNCPFPYDSVDMVDKMVNEYEMEFESIYSAAKLFEVPIPEPKTLRKCRREIGFSKLLWDYINIVDTTTANWKATPWRTLDTESMDLECKRMAKEVKAMDKDIRSWELFLHLESTVRHIASSLKSVGELQNPNITQRHWEELLKGTKILKRLIPFLVEKFSQDMTAPLADLYSLGLHNYEEEVKNIVDKAVKESSIDKTLKEVRSTWAVQEYSFEIHAKTGLKLLKVPEEVVEILEENQVQLQTIAMSKYIAFFKDEVKYWQSLLGHADKVLTTTMEVQRTWCHLESIFKSSEDIRVNLPEDSARFDQIEQDLKIALSWLEDTTNVIKGTMQERIYPEISRLQAELSYCEKAVADYLETKRLKFPRFYFVSSADLLDILSTSNEPLKVMRHLPKLFDSIDSLQFTPDSDSSPDRKNAHSMRAKDGELVTLKNTCLCSGQVENWLSLLEHSMRSTVRHYMKNCVHAYGGKSREDWIRDFPAQVALCGTQIWWNNEVSSAFSVIEEGGNENALKEYFRKQVIQLNTLINLLVGELSAQDRQKVMTICTIDVHSRDVVGKLIQMRIESSRAFQWQSQLRHRWDTAEGDCFANICDAQLRYLHEYLGNTPRLVITPLTDRCYITLTQSVHLIMGGAPAGPAGTGKTETTKDLGRALGIMVYVFNCSEQMDYCSVGSIFKGLSMTGAWGCFDEFNRISVEVLSVVAVQVKSILDAIRERKVRYNFMGEEIRLVSSVGIFITMNPGYAGRSELPENLKVLFRPCAMVVPDFELICEIMLVAEGFQEARILARKFITLYTLCKELLSKQDHYDWGLRAIKSVLVVAGSLKRADAGSPESEVLMRALRDFNVPKIISDDIPVFMGLIGDLFPALDVPRRRDIQFERIVKDATKELLLQPEENFLLKVVQLQELMNVRHSVFIVGNAGTGKTQVWKTLFTSYHSMGMNPVYSDLNPKAVTSDELFGVINPATREWKDGIFSVLMREQANMTSEGPKWIVLDGDIDPMWIESLNTVMDDNKILTLASNERIPLTKTMRLLFEIHTLKHATPATVSRAGILYLNPQDLNWNVYVLSWLRKRNDPPEVRAILMQLFDKYVPPVLEQLKTRFKKIIPIPEVSLNVESWYTVRCNAKSANNICLVSLSAVVIMLFASSRLFAAFSFNV